MRNNFHSPILNFVHVLENLTEKVVDEFENLFKTLLANLEATLTAGKGEKRVSCLQGR
jgi:hypothetical protein